MAGYTYRQIVYEIWESIKENYSQADTLIPKILYWVSVSANRLMQQRLKKQFDQTGRLSGRSMTIFTGLPVKTFATSTNPNQVAGIKYIEVPEKLFDLDFDREIDYITYNSLDPNCCYGPNFTQINFTRTSPREAKRLYMNPYEKPSEKNPYYYRTAGDYLYLLGMECSQIESLDIGVRVAMTYTNIKDLDEAIPLSEDLIEQLKIQVISLGRFVQQIPRDRANDGDDTTPELLRGVSNSSLQQLTSSTQQAQE